MKIRAIVAGIVVSFSLFAASCDWHIFPYNERSEDVIRDDNLIASLDEIAGTWRSGDDLVLRYSLGDAFAYLSVDGAVDIPATLEDLTGHSLYVDKDFPLYWPDNTAGEKVMICRKDAHFIAGFTHIGTNKLRTYTLSRQ